MDLKKYAAIALAVTRQIVAITPTTKDDVIVSAIEAAWKLIEPLFGASGEAPALPPEVQAVVESVVAEYQA